MKILKAEVLITRKCNLSCKYCKIPKIDRKELSVLDWRDAFRIIYEDLGASFIAIYGGEPLCLGLDNLIDVVYDLSKYRPAKSYTIISNSVGLTTESMIRLVNAGLDSWTASVDTINNTETEVDGYTFAKSSRGLKVLTTFSKMGLRDTCGIITANRKNLFDIVRTVKVLNEYGIWASIDLIHYSKSTYQGGLPNKHAIRDIVFTRDDLDNLRHVSDELISMKHKGGLIFNTYETLEQWKNPNYSVDLNWKCGSKEPICVTVDSDGSLMECDSFRGPAISKYNIFNVASMWKEFSEDYMEDVSLSCPGCFWSTHYCAEGILKNNNEKYYQHEIRSELSK